MAYLIDRTLTFFDKHDDELAGELPLVGIDLADLQRLFDVPPVDPMYECYIVGPEHVPTLQPHVSEPIDLDRYDYFVEATGTPISEEAQAVEPLEARATSTGL